MESRRVLLVERSCNDWETNNRDRRTKSFSVSIPFDEGVIKLSFFSRSFVFPFPLRPT